MDGTNTIVDGANLKNATEYIYQVTFTMDDYIYVDRYKKDIDNNISIDKSIGFYLEDIEQNGIFEDSYTGITSENIGKVRESVIKHLKNKKKEVITNISMAAVSEAVNKNNQYATKLGINYNFSFVVESKDTWYDSIEGIGMLAVIQGIPIGNKYLDYNAYGMSALMVSEKYYISEGDGSTSFLLKQKLYHVNKNCPIYQDYIFKKRVEYEYLSPKFYYNKSEAAANGYTPCPTCRP